MSISNRDFIEAIKFSRTFFHKHLVRMTEEQVAWKPYPECKSVLETLKHLIIDDLAALSALQSGAEPNYESFKVEEAPYEVLISKLKESHLELTEYLETRFGPEPMDAAASAWGTKLPAARAIALLSSEDFYHAGQVSFIRSATDPTWDYYAKVYGDE